MPAQGCSVHKPVRRVAMLQSSTCVFSRLLCCGCILVCGVSCGVQIKPLTRFLCDASLSGGSWLWACATPTQQQQQQQASGAAAGVSSSQALFQIVPAGSRQRRSSCDVEVVCSWRCLHSLTPDATQLAEPDWRPQVRPALHHSAFGLSACKSTRGVCLFACTASRLMPHSWQSPTGGPR